MGNKASGEELKSKRLSMSISEARKQEQAKLKLLLLGAGESGKSTLFKQMKVIYGAGYTEEERNKLKPFILGNVVEGAIDIYEAGNQILGHDFSNADVTAAGEMLKGLPDKRVMNDEIAEAVNLMWSDPEYQEVWSQRSHFQLQDTWHEYAESMKSYPAWGGDAWVPSMEDVLKSRVRTTGIVDELFNVPTGTATGGSDKKKNFIKLRMLDVGGQRNERRKWLHCFEGVTSVIFVVSLSEYDQTLFEDSTKNRLQESLELFQEISNSTWFKDSALILFFNKMDLFEEKYLKRKVPLNETGLFPSAPVGEPNVDVAKAWFEKMFRDQLEDKSRTIYVFWTTATDTSIMQAVMRSSSQHILRVNLKGAGVLL